jgi:hypothetical protein
MNPIIQNDPNDAAKEAGNVPANRDKGHVPVNGDDPADRGESSLDADARHRREFARYASQDSHQPYREPISRLYASWWSWNDNHFDGRMQPPHILLAEPKSPRAFGDHSLLSGWGSTNQIRIRPSILNGTHPSVRPGDQYAEGRFLLTRDIALHETIHQFATEILKQPEEAYRGHGPVFRDLCNRIGATDSSSPVRTAKARGLDRERPSCAQFPICVRPKGFYLGAYLPHEIEESTTDGETESQTPPAPPKHLADWIAGQPAWAEQYRQFGDLFFELLDRFFEAYPAPKPVQEQAVIFLAKSYRHRVRTRPSRQLALPAPPGT